MRIKRTGIELDRGEITVREKGSSNNIEGLRLQSNLDFLSTL